MKLLFPEPQKLSLLRIDSCVQTINISKTKGSNSDRFTMSSMVVKHSYISCECAVSLFSAHSLINSLFVGYQLKAKHRWSFLFIPALCSCVTVKWMLFMFAVFSIPFIGLEAYWVHWSWYHFSCVLVAYIIILLCH